MLHRLSLRASKLSVITTILLPTLLLPVRLIQSDEVDDVMKAIMKCHDVPGASVAMVKGNASWVRGYGVQDFGSGRPVTGDTLFMMTSLSKAFTSALTAKALEKNRLDSKSRGITWHTPIREILGDDVISFPRGLENVSLHDVFTHQSGLSPNGLMQFATFPSSLSRGDFLKQFDKLGEMAGYKGKYLPNNWAYGLGRDVIEKNLKISYGTALKRYIFGPLGMRSSGLMWDDVNTTSQQVARPYQNFFNGTIEEIHPSVFQLEQAKASTMIVSSANDMTKWMRLLLNNGLAPDGRRLISQRLLNDTVTSQESFYYSLGFGYGWFIGSYRGVKTHYDSGGWYSYKASLAFFPEKKTAISVFLNGPSFSPAFKAAAHMFRVLSDVALDLSPTINYTMYVCPDDKLQRKEKSVEDMYFSDFELNDFGLSPNSKDRQRRDDVMASSPDSPFRLENFNRTKYAGTFLNSFFGKVVISVAGNDSFRLNGSKGAGAGHKGQPGSKSPTSSGASVGLFFRLQKVEGYLVAGPNETEFQINFTGKLEFFFKEFSVFSRLKFGSLTDAEGRYTSLFVRGPGQGLNDREVLPFTRV